jgi:hypothetical protein
MTTIDEKIAALEGEIKALQDERRTVGDERRDERRELLNATTAKETLLNTLIQQRPQGE